MSSEEIFKFLRTSPSFLEDSDSHFCCVICQKILVHTCCGPCACEYCRECAEKLFEKGQFCPGPSEECNLRKINYDEDITVNRATDRRIATLLVKCSHANESCDFTGTVAEMAVHLRQCLAYVTTAECPFAVLGCDVVLVTETALATHLSTAESSHSMLMLTQMLALKESVRVEEEKNRNFSTEIVNLKEDNTELRKEMEGLREENSKIIENFISDVGSKMNHENILEDSFNTLQNTELLTTRMSDPQSPTEESIDQVFIPNKTEDGDKYAAILAHVQQLQKQFEEFQQSMVIQNQLRDQEKSDAVSTRQSSSGEGSINGKTSNHEKRKEIDSIYSKKKKSWKPKHRSTSQIRLLCSQSSVNNRPISPITRPPSPNQFEWTVTELRQHGRCHDSGPFMVAGYLLRARVRWWSGDDGVRTDIFLESQVEQMLPIPYAVEWRLEEPDSRTCIGSWRCDKNILRSVTKVPTNIGGHYQIALNHFSRVIDTNSIIFVLTVI